MIKAGGDCFWDPENCDHRKNILLIAGGIGINPLFSIIQHIEELRQEGKYKLGKTVLLFSAKTECDLHFKVIS